MTKPRVLIVDDDEDIRTQMKWALVKDYEVEVAEDRAGALSSFQSHSPLVTLLDLGLPPRPNEPVEGFATLTAVLALEPGAKVIVVSGQGDKENALRAVGSGAYDFLCKPVDTEQLKFLLQRCVYVAQLEQEYQHLQQSVLGETFEGMLGTSAPMQAMFNFVRKVAPTDAPVLILGESGTGKEMVAQAIHKRSAKKGGAFVGINCSAIPEGLIESELFGHERGAFTGAHAQRKGMIETAAGGTLFLDEIGDLPGPVQVKFLRFLQEKRFQRVGGRQEIHSDTRVVAATNVNLQDSVSRGGFREDLYFRLAVVVVKVPPLRERGDDVGRVAKEFLRRYSSQHKKGATTFAADATTAMNQHTWPGNVRELQNRVQRAVIMADGRRVTADDLELADVLATQAPQTLREAREAVERDLVRHALQRHGGRITAAALELGVSRPTLYELMEKLHIEKD